MTDSDASSHANVTFSKSIVRFVKDIERHPCLYDPTSVQYLDRELKRKTWMHIAHKTNTTVAECKERWRKIRIAYLRSLKPRYFMNGVRMPSKPYYLANYLQFIKPREMNLLNNKKHLSSSLSKKLTSKNHKREIKIETGVNNDDVLIINDQGNKYEIAEKVIFDEDHNTSDDDDEDDIIIEEEEEEKKRDHNRGYKKEFKSKNIPNKANFNIFDKIEIKDIRAINENNEKNESTESRCTYCVNIESQPRKMFLFSILPDIDSLSDQQMRIFRRGLIDLIDKCKYGDN